MFCPKCGATVSPGAKICYICKTDLTVNPPEAPPVYPAASCCRPPMRWYDFLTCFGLFACAFFNLQAVFTYLLIAGAFAQSPQFVASRYFYLFMLLPSLFCAGFAIITWFRLIGFRKNGPKLLHWFLIINAAQHLPFLIMMCFPPFTIIGLPLTVVYIVASYKIIVSSSYYFQKRISLFDKP